MIQYISSKNSPAMKIHENYFNSETAGCLLTLEDLNEQIRNYITPETKQLKVLIRLNQEMSSTQHQNLPKGKYKR